MLRITALAIPLLLFVVLGGMAIPPPQPPPHTVNTTNDVDDGTCDATHCSLREAINAANGDTVTSTIDFNIPTSDPGFNPTTTAFTIRPTSSLPTITAPVVIDGYTQPGAAANNDRVRFNGTLKIELDGSLAGIYGLKISGGSTSVRGLVINRFGETGIALDTKGSNIIQGNFIGIDVAGTADRGNARYGIIAWSGASNNTIGGMSASERNVISANGHTGIALFESGNLVLGNLIGTEITGTADLGNRFQGVSVQDASANIIGSGANGARNVISGNGANAIGIVGAATGNVIQGNLIGTNVTADGMLGNTTDGVAIGKGASNNVVGGVGPEERNIIAYNGGAGISLITPGTGNSILSNSIYSNAGVGIDLGDNGVTPNDAGDGDAGVNNLQNFPVVASALLGTDGVLAVQYSVDSATVNSAYPLRIEFFKADADGEEGQTFLGSDTYTSGSAQTTTTVVIGGAAGLGLTGGDVIVGTATDANNNTSEFSAGVQVTAVATPIPTAGHWGLVAMASVVAVLLVWRVRRGGRVPT